MTKVWILIGIAILIFSCAGQAQYTQEEIIYTKMLHQAERKLDSIKCSKLVDICTFETFKKENEKDMDELYSYFGRVADTRYNIIRVDLSACLSYRSYKKYRKCMLIFNK